MAQGLPHLSVTCQFSQLKMQGQMIEQPHEVGDLTYAIETTAPGVGTTEDTASVSLLCPAETLHLLIVPCSELVCQRGYKDG